MSELSKTYEAEAGLHYREGAVTFAENAALASLLRALYHQQKAMLVLLEQLVAYTTP